MLNAKRNFVLLFTKTMSNSLCDFIRIEAKQQRSNPEVFFSRHVQTCMNSTCPYPNCQLVRSKLKHFEQCNVSACMACASARLTWLHCRHLLPPSFVQRFVNAQTEMMQAALEPSLCNYANARFAFVEVLLCLYQLWEQRDFIIAPIQQQHSTMIRLNAETRSVYHTWETSIAACKRV